MVAFFVWQRDYIVPTSGLLINPAATQTQKTNDSLKRFQRRVNSSTTRLKTEDVSKAIYYFYLTLTHNLIHTLITLSIQTSKQCKETLRVNSKQTPKLFKLVHNIFWLRILPPYFSSPSRPFSSHDSLKPVSTLPRSYT